MIIFITDSRGRGLKEFIEENNSLDGAEFQVITERGLTLEQAEEKIKQIQTFDLAVLYVGICNFTEKTEKIIRYPNNPIKFNNTIATINRILEEFGNKILIPTIYAADLAKHNNNRLGIQFEEQKHLEEDVDFANKIIIDNNKRLRKETIQLHKNLKRSSIGSKGKYRSTPRVRWNYKDLVDGVHENEYLKAKNLKHLCTVTLHHKQKIYKELILRRVVQNTKEEEKEETTPLFPLNLEVQPSEGAEKQAEIDEDPVPGLEPDSDTEDWKIVDTWEASSAEDCLDVLDWNWTDSQDTDSQEDTGNFKRAKSKTN